MARALSRIFLPSGRLAGALWRAAALVLLLVFAWPGQPEAQSRIKDIAAFEGVRDG